MENYGKKITDLRKKKNLTQSELGEMLNVTPQAVSKWENGLSEPDLGTLRKMCEIFNVTTDELLGVEASTNETDNVKTTQTVVETKIINGYCNRCKKPVGPDEYVVENGYGGQKIYCNECAAKNRKEAHDKVVNEERESFRRGLIRGGIWGGTLTLIFAIAAISAGSIEAFLGGLLIAYMVFAFRAQFAWDNSVTDCFGFFLRSFRAPGVIFELSLDGFIFLILAKLLFAVIGFLFTTIFFLIGVVVSFVYAAFAFPFALIAQLNNLKKFRRTC